MPCSDLLWPKLRESQLAAHLRSVLSAREMAGFLTALLQAALLLQEGEESQCLPGKEEVIPEKGGPMEDKNALMYA